MFSSQRASQDAATANRSYPIAPYIEARECSAQIQAVAFGAESRNRCVSAFQGCGADVKLHNKRGNQHECKCRMKQQRKMRHTNSSGAPDSGQQSENRKAKVKAGYPE